MHGDPLLADWVSEHIGDDWITNLSHIEKMAIYATDKKAQQEFMNIKYQNKLRLAKIHQRAQRHRSRSAFHL